MQEPTIIRVKAEGCDVGKHAAKTIAWTNENWRLHRFERGCFCPSKSRCQWKETEMKELTASPRTMSWARLFPNLERARREERDPSAGCATVPPSSDSANRSSRELWEIVQGWTFNSCLIDLLRKASVSGNRPTRVVVTAQLTYWMAWYDILISELITLTVVRLVSGVVE